MSSSPLANWNGEIMSLDEVKVSVLDRAFLFGDAIYEMIRVYHGKPFLFDDHLHRLERNLEKMQLKADAAIIKNRVIELLEKHPVPSATIYIQITRGQAKRTHHFPSADVTPNELIYVAEFDDPYVTARTQGVSVIMLPDLRWKRCDIKSVNLLANCMAAETAKQAGCAEAILVAEDGTLIEGTHTSLFGVKDGSILTAPLGEHILPGITRKLLMELAQKVRVPVQETSLHKDDLPNIDELFLTGTTIELFPIVRVDDQVIGAGTPGPVVRKLLQAYAERICS